MTSTLDEQVYLFYLLLCVRKRWYNKHIIFEFAVFSTTVGIHQGAAAVLHAVEELAGIDVAIAVFEGAPTVPGGKM